MGKPGLCTAAHICQFTSAEITYTPGMMLRLLAPKADALK